MFMMELIGWMSIDTVNMIVKMFRLLPVIQYMMPTIRICFAGPYAKELSFFTQVRTRGERIVPYRGDNFLDIAFRARPLFAGG